MNQQLVKQISEAVLLAIRSIDLKPNEEDHKGELQNNNEKEIHQDKERLNQGKRSGQEKREIALHALRSGNNSLTAQKFCVNEKTVRRYKDQYLTQEDLKQNKNKKTNNRPSQLSMEKQLVQWIQQQRSEQKVVSMKDIKNKALNLKDNYKFSASNGWFQRFISRNNIRLRTPTHIMQQCGTKVYQNLQQFYNYLFDFRVQMSRENKQIIFLNADETPVQLNFKRKTFDFKGSKQISVKGIKTMKQRFTALLMVSSQGTKYPPLIIGKGNFKTKLTNNFPKHCIIIQNKNAWITQDLYLLYLKTILGNLIYDKTKFKLCYIHDKCSSHTGIAVEKYLKSIEVEQFLVPAGATSLCQILDVVVNKPLKDKIHQEFHVCNKRQIDNGDENFILNPTVQDYTYILLDAINNIKQESIINGWKTCGINNNLDESENSLINKHILDQQSLCLFIKQLFTKQIQESDSELLNIATYDSTQTTYEVIEFANNSEHINPPIIKQQQSYLVQDEIEICINSNNNRILNSSEKQNTMEFDENIYFSDDEDDNIEDQIDFDSHDIDPDQIMDEEIISDEQSSISVQSNNNKINSGKRSISEFNGDQILSKQIISGQQPTKLIKREDNKHLSSTKTESLSEQQQQQQPVPTNFMQAEDQEPFQQIAYYTPIDYKVDLQYYLNEYYEDLINQKLPKKNDEKSKNQKRLLTYFTKQ